jgi:hypothetical protein
MSERADELHSFVANTTTIVNLACEVLTKAIKVINPVQLTNKKTLESCVRNFFSQVGDTTSSIDADDWTAIKDVLTLTRNGLIGNLTIKVDTMGSNSKAQDAKGYVDFKYVTRENDHDVGKGGAHGGVQGKQYTEGKEYVTHRDERVDQTIERMRLGAIHLSKVLVLDDDETVGARGLIHEATHKYGKTYDKWYCNLLSTNGAGRTDIQCSRMAMHEGLINADSYACFAMQAYWKAM